MRDFNTFQFFQRQFLRLLRCLIDLKKFYTIRVGDFCSIMVEHPKSVFQERKANHPRGGGNNNIVSKLSIELKACIAFFEQTKNISQVPPNGQGVPCPACGKKFFTRG